jgi:CRISPR/Cas system CSM-associated protein Csm5 (group 7 of RAMP superfamily)
MTNALENTELVSSRIWTIMVESGQDDFYVAGIFTDENLALSALADLSQRLEEENNIHSDYVSNRISARLVSHPVHDSTPQYHMLYTVTMLRNPSNLEEWITFHVRRELHTTTSLLEYAQNNKVVAQLVNNPTRAFRDDAISDGEMQEFVTFDPDNITFATELPRNN